jgi:DNA-directed RNA polymerase specialized sigma24 family protein
MTAMDGGAEERFRAFVAEVEPRLARALLAAYGRERGREAMAEALAYAWEHWERVEAMANPAGYLYRVGQSRTRSRLRPVAVPDRVVPEAPWVEPRLSGALQQMTERQRVAVVLIHGFEWTFVEVASLLGISVPSVQRHLERGLAKLRASLGVDVDV